MCRNAQECAYLHKCVETYRNVQKRTGLRVLKKFPQNNLSDFAYFFRKFWKRQVRHLQDYNFLQKCFLVY